MEMLGVVWWFGVGARMREARSAGVREVDPTDVVDWEAGMEEVEDAEGGVAGCCCFRDGEVVIMRVRVIDGV